MPSLFIPIFKFVGTVSLGLLTGVSYSNTFLAAPALLSLPSSSTAYHATSKLKARSAQHSTVLVVLSVASYTIAYALSPPRRGRHPYLLWTSFVASVGFGAAHFLEYQATKEHPKSKRESDSRIILTDHDTTSDDEYIDATHSTVNLLTPTSGSDDESGQRVSKSGLLNGEGVLKGIEDFASAETIRAASAGLAFLMGVIGLWGDGAIVVQRR